MRDRSILYSVLDADQIERQERSNRRGCPSGDDCPGAHKCPNFCGAPTPKTSPTLKQKSFSKAEPSTPSPRSGPTGHRKRRPRPDFYPIIFDNHYSPVRPSHAVASAGSPAGSSGYLTDASAPTSDAVSFSSTQSPTSNHDRSDDSATGQPDPSRRKSLSTPSKGVKKRPRILEDALEAGRRHRRTSLQQEAQLNLKMPKSDFARLRTAEQHQLKLENDAYLRNKRASINAVNEVQVGAKMSCADEQEDMTESDPARKKRRVSSALDNPRIASDKSKVGRKLPHYT